MAAQNMSTVSALRASLSAAKPPAGISMPLAALWWAAKNEWDKAHSMVQGDDGGDAAWVHAYLHRVEGDNANAAYWYRRAGHDPSKASLDAEWGDIAGALLGKGGS
jgi:hypothetical protein